MEKLRKYQLKIDLKITDFFAQYYIMSCIEFGDFCLVCDSVQMSVCNSVAKELYLGYNFRTVGNRDFIFGIHTFYIKNIQLWTLLPSGAFLFTNTPVFMEWSSGHLSGKRTLP